NKVQEEAQVQEAGPGPNDIIFVKKSYDPARSHKNLKNMSVWEGKIPAGNNPAYAFNKQQDNQTAYADTPYMPQLMASTRKAITNILKEELYKKNQIKTSLVIESIYAKYKYKGEGDAMNKANYELSQTHSYHRGKQHILLSENDIDPYLIQS
ncbi:679_t:CDS:2, partial [Racocetra fulgida]